MIKRAFVCLTVSACASGIMCEDVVGMDYENTVRMNENGIRERVVSFFKEKPNGIRELEKFCSQQAVSVEGKIKTAKEEGYCPSIFADKCDLALEYFRRFRSNEDNETLLGDLIESTNNGFYDVSSFAINESGISSDLKQKATALLKETWMLLWNMRETLDVKLASGNISVALSDLLMDRLFSSVFLVRYIEGLDSLTESLWK